MKKHKLDPKYTHKHIIAEVEAQILEQVNQDTEELQFQLNNMRKDISTIKKKKDKELADKNPFSEFSFDQENPDSSEPNSTFTAKCITTLIADVRSMQVEMESVQRGITKKSNIKDTCALLDAKANTKDVFQVFEEIKRSIEIVSSK